jgi:type IV pilus assembly protein PilA
VSDPLDLVIKEGEVMLRKLRERTYEGQRGFSLIELLVVILIIGVLAAIALPAFLGQREKGQDSSAKSAVRNLVSGMESFYATNKTYVGAEDDDDVKKMGVLGTGDGQASVEASGQNSYIVVGHSASGNTFQIAKSGSTVNRTCQDSGEGACPGGTNGGKW